MKRKESFLVFLVFALVETQVCAQVVSADWSWIKLSPSVGPSPGGRRDGTLVYDSLRRRLILFGGLNAGTHFNEVWALDLRTVSWTRLDPSGPSPEAGRGHNAIYDPVTHEMIVWAGQQGGRFFNDTWVLDLNGLKWRDVSPQSRPAARYGSASIFDPVERQLVQFAGFTSEAGRFQDTQSFNLDSFSWRDLTPAGEKPQIRCLLTPAVRPPGRFFASSFVDPVGRFVVFGGTTDAGSVNETWIFDPKTREWTRLDLQNPPAPRNGMMGAYIPEESRLIIFGGEGTAHLNDLWELRPAVLGAANRIHFAHFGNGSTLTSSTLLTNASTTEAASGLLSFFNDRGQPLAVSLNGADPVTSVSFTLSPHPTRLQAGRIHNPPRRAPQIAFLV